MKRLAILWLFSIVLTPATSAGSETMDALSESEFKEHLRVRAETVLDFSTVAKAIERQRLERESIECAIIMIKTGIWIANL